ncbi:MAG TPA: hypothetical protein DET40_03130 [Lentisphaeria bacterium]|nr:MAG: hypothetical protein A2X45_12995 [Lentisphaerae bacterium GWF2_50_93]HCE42524.1 hypothetical protein [Lentisphaeria bacterium]
MRKRKTSRSVDFGKRGDPLFDMFCFFIFFAPFAVIPFIYDYSNLAQAVYLQTGAVLFSCIIIFRMIRAGKIILPDLKILAPVMLLLAWAGLSVIWSCNRYEPLPMLLQWTAALAIFIVAVNFVRDLGSAAILLRTMFYSGAFVAIMGISQYLSGIQILPQEYPPASTFANRNVASEFIVLCLPIGVGILLNERTRLLVFSSAIGISSMLLFLFYSYTRSCILAVLAAACVVAVVLIALKFSGRLKFKLDRNQTAGLILIAVLFAVGSSMTPKGFQIYRLGMVYSNAAATAQKFKSAADKVQKNEEHDPTIKQKESESVYFRLAAWKNSLVMIKNHPILGVGLANLKVYYPAYHRKAVYDGMSGEKKALLNLHNDYLQVLAELGIVGFLLLLAALAAVAWLLFNSIWRSDGEPAGRIYAAAIAVSFLGYAVVSFFGFPASRAVHVCWVGLLVAMLAVISGKTDLRMFKMTAPGGRSLLLIRALLLCVLLAAGFAGYMRLKADRSFLIMDAAARDGKHKEAILYANEVLKTDPTRKIVYSYLGRAYSNTGCPAEGIEFLRKLLGYYPYHITALINIGAAYNELGDYDKANEYYMKGLEIAPESAALHNNYGNLLSRRGKNEEALYEFSLAVKYESDNAIYIYNRGYMELQLGKRKDALESFKLALKLKPGWDLPGKQIRTLESGNFK